MCGRSSRPLPDAPPTLTRNEPPPQDAPEQAAGSQEESQTSLPKSDDWYRAVISLGVKMAEADARRMLALKTQRVWSSMGRKGPPPDLWSRLEEAERKRTEITLVAKDPLRTY